MKIDLTNKIALVTGSTLGIGFATARGLHQCGATVVINGRSQDRVDEAVGRLGSGDRVFGVAADVGTAEGCQRLVEAVPRVDVLVNNAGVFLRQPAFEIPDDEWFRLFETNVMSGVRLSRAYGPGMVDRGWGRIVFVSSESGMNIPPEMIHYGTSKLAQLGVSRGLAEAVAGTGVTVNTVLPGPTNTEGNADFLRALIDSGEAKDAADAQRVVVEKERPTSLLRRFATPEEVANMIVYLASPLSAATSGAVLRADGGVVRSVV
jgi:NAD(P)-dependent dehydrogenase (short-subunit alcohol dehydrogenase family)